MTEYLLIGGASFLLGILVGFAITIRDQHAYRDRLMSYARDSDEFAFASLQKFDRLASRIRSVATYGPNDPTWTKLLAEVEAMEEVKREA